MWEEGEGRYSFCSSIIPYKSFLLLREAMVGRLDGRVCGLYCTSLEMVFCGWSVWGVKVVGVGESLNTHG